MNDLIFTQMSPKGNDHAFGQINFFDMKLTTEFFIILFVNVTRAPRIYIRSTPSHFQTEIKFHLRSVWKPKMNNWCRLAITGCGILRICPDPVTQTGMLCKGICL